MPDQLLDTPIMPTGSGVADLEIARELDALTGGDDEAAALTPTDEPGDGARVESEAHPS